MAPILSCLAAGLLVMNIVFAHPGHNVADEAAERNNFLKRGEPKSVRSCASQLARRGHHTAAIQRRSRLAQEVRAKRSLSHKTLVRRDFAAYNTSHAASNVTFGDDETLLFADNSSCILQPEIYRYYVDGELIRSDLTEDQEGVPLYLDVQYIDTSTCEPVPAVFVDFWHCNATGVYSGVSASGNGDSSDASNLNNTFLRGHYTGRATHIHILSHNVNSTIVRTNGTLLASNGTTHASHVGQIFFDQSLISTIDTVAPYNTNTQETTVNADDSILGEEADTMDPFAEYVLLGDSVEDGILAWISIGVDPTADSEVSSAATKYKGYAVANSNSMGGGPGGNSTGGGSGGAAPSGSPPSS
nr:hypothetical protein CFP56_11558 [Quercus suber]